MSYFATNIYCWVALAPGRLTDITWVPDKFASAWFITMVSFMTEKPARSYDEIYKNV